MNEKKVDVVSMIGTECTTGNLKRLLPGSNRLRVILKPKYCFRVRIMSVLGVSLISAPIDKFQCEKRLQLIWGCY